MPCQKLYKVFEVQSFGLDTGSWTFCHSFIAQSRTHCSTQKYGVRMCQVTIVVMVTTQLVLSKFELFTAVNW